MHLFYQPDLQFGHLSSEDSKHAVKVLRLATNTEIELTDGLGNLLRAMITHPDPGKCRYKILDSRVVPKRNFSIHIAVSPTKNIDRMEWLLEKCTEIGVERVSFIQCQASERKSLNLDRLHKISVSALKQSRQAWLPVLSPLTHFKEIVQKSSESHKFIAHVDAGNPVQLLQLIVPYTDSLILIGPEGDFSTSEVETAMASGFTRVGLGPTRLRTETAAFAAVMTVHFVNQK